MPILRGQSKPASAVGFWGLKMHSVQNTARMEVLFRPVIGKIFNNLRHFVFWQDMRRATDIAEQIDAGEGFKRPRCLRRSASSDHAAHLLADRSPIVGQMSVVW